MQNTYKDMGHFIRAYYDKHPYGHYFDRDTLKFFGERISDMRLLKGEHTVTDISGEKHNAICISRIQRNHPGGSRRTYAYFDAETLEDIILP